MIWVSGKLASKINFQCPKCSEPQSAIGTKKDKKSLVLDKNAEFEFVDRFCYLGDMISAGGSDVSPWPWPVLKDKLKVLGLDLGLERQVLGLGLGLEHQVLAQVLGLEAQVLGLGLGLAHCPWP